MRYFIRSLKYFCALCVLLAVLIAFNLNTGIASLSLKETLYVMFHTPRGAMLPAAVVLLAALYPKFGFIARRIEGDTAKHRTQIVNAMLASGYSLRSETDGVLHFRTDSPVQRAAMLFDDEVTARQEGSCILLAGNRRGVARAAYRLDSYIQRLEK
ncbi:MAG: hypothetical protein K2I59_07650 [Alistipes sp.]|nr:hypothetical protein [Alistipes sp.]